MKKLWNKIKRWWRKMFGVSVVKDDGVRLLRERGFTLGLLEM